MTKFIFYIYVFLIGSLSYFDVSINGNFVIGELLLLCGFPILCLKAFKILPRRQGKLLIWFIVLGFGSMAWIFVADYFNHIPFGMSVRQFIKHSLIVIETLPMIVLVAKGRSFLYAYLAGLLIAGILKAFGIGSRHDLFQATEYAEFVFTMNTLIMAIAYNVILWTKSDQNRFSGVISIITGVFFAVFSSRNTAVSWLLVGLVSFIANSKNHFTKKLSMFKVLVWSILGLILTIGIYYGYRELAVEGLLGDRQYTKMTTQATTVFGATPIGVILAGRPHTLPYLLMIKDSPWIGSGSYPDMISYFIEAERILGADIFSVGMLNEYGTVGEHSVILNLVTSYGIIMIPFCALLVYFCVLAIMNYLKVSNELCTYFYLSFSLLVLWALFFSPLSGSGRLMISVLIASSFVISGKIDSIPQHIRHARELANIRNRHDSKDGH